MDVAAFTGAFDGNRFCAGKRGTGLDSGKERRRKNVTKGSDKYYRYKDGAMQKIHGLRSVRGRTIF